MAKIKQTARKNPPFGATRLPLATVGKIKIYKGGIKRRYRYHQSTRAIMEIKKYQNSTALSIPRISFQKLVKELVQNFQVDLRMQSAALEALREASEMYITELFENANLCAIHSKRVTIKPKDLHISRRIQFQKI